MSNDELKNELVGLNNLALGLYRNDEGIVGSREYHEFSHYLRLLREEAIKRKIYTIKRTSTSIVHVCTECGEITANKVTAVTENLVEKMVFWVCPKCDKRRTL